MQEAPADITAPHPKTTTLRSPPIIEAVVDFRCLTRYFSGPAPLPDLPPLPGFGSARQIHLNEVALTVEEGPPESVTTVRGKRHLGYRLDSTDGGRVIQLRRDGFGFSKLRPYSNWSEVLAGVKEHWKTYLGLFEPSAVTRLAIRTINEIVIPNTRSLSDYFVRAPAVPPGPLQDLDGFSERFVVTDTSGHRNVIVTRTGQAAERGSKTVIFDIDASLTGEWTPAGDTRHLWDALESVRNLKNHFFLAALTDECLEQLQ